MVAVTFLDEGPGGEQPFAFDEMRVAARDGCDALLTGWGASQTRPRLGALYTRSGRQFRFGMTHI